MKPVVGTSLQPIFTQHVDPTKLDDASIRLSPAIYQEYIEGSVHLRVNCFGESVHTASLSTQELDWRLDLTVPINAHDLDADTCRRVIAILNKMELAMGIVDLKLTPIGEPVWFEVNPQGQFLFLEGVSQQSLLDHVLRFSGEEGPLLAS